MFLTLPENRRSCRTGFYHAVTVLGSTILAIACAPTTRTSPAPVAGLLSPGARDLATAHFRDASVKFHFTQLAPNEATPRRGPGDGQVETRVTSYKGVPALLFIRSFVGRGAPFLDTALVLRDGLVPVWEIHHQGTRRTRFDYSGSHVTVEVTAPDSVRRRVEHLYTVPSFHFNELDELISSIPLHSGYHAIVPLYSEGDDALEMDTVDVEGQDSTGTWNVRFADKVIIGHYGIDAATRTILRHDAERHTGGVRVRYVEDTTDVTIGPVPTAFPNVPTPLVVQPVPFGLFAPDDMSWTFNAAFTPDGRSVYFSKSESGLVGLTIFVSHEVRGSWTSPQVVPFSGQYGDTDPAVTADGKAIVFSSRRPPLGQSDRYALYEAFLSGPRAGTVVPLPNNASTLGDELSSSIARDGTLYFTVRASGVKRIYRAPSMNGQYARAEALTIPGDTSGVSDRDAAVDPEQRFIIFSSDRTGGLGAQDIYVSYRRGTRWCPPMHLPPPINSASSELGTQLSRDGRTLFFSSNRSSLEQPTERRINAADFHAQLAGYENGSLRLYRSDIGPWLDSVAPSTC